MEPLAPPLVTLLTFATWLVAIYSLKAFVQGNPTYTLVHATPEPLLVRAMEYMEEAEVPDDEPLAHFLRRFYLLKLLRTVVFGLEFGTLLVLLVADPGFPLTWFLLGKHLFLYHLLYRLQYQEDGNPLLAILALPGWYVRWERAGHLVSALCYGVLCCRVNGLL
jgi:hypothetical protein